MTAAVCPVCFAAQAEGLLCHDCTTSVERELGDVAAIVGELEITISKQARIGAAGASGLARERTPINVGAMLVADDLGNTLTTWARDVVGDEWPIAACKAGVRVLDLVDRPAVAAARLLLSNIPAVRKHSAVVELVDEITDAIRQARRVVDRPADKVYLGQCLLETPDDEGRQVTCLAELYARPQAHEVQCRTCGAEHEVAERRAWLLQRAADMLVTVKEASSYLGEIGGIRVTESSIRGYIHRGARLAYHAPVEAKRFRLGDLLTVVLDEGERRSA